LSLTKDKTAGIGAEFIDWINVIAIVPDYAQGTVRNGRITRPWTGSDSHMWIKEFDMNLFKQFVRDESGATAIEYGLIAAGISVAIIVVVQGLGSRLTATFTSVKSALN
jgi:pilus assembly protein Flp/PilA